MTSRPLQTLAAAAALIGLLLTANWYFSTEQKISRRLQRIQKLVAKIPTESDLSGLAKARSLSEMFAEPFTISARPEDYSTSDRQTLIRGIHQYRSRSSTLAMEITGQQIFLDATGDGANSFFTVRFLADLDDLRGADQYDVRIHWRDEDGTWQISDVQVSAVQ